MPSYERELDLIQGYNFKKDVQKPIGFLTVLTVGGLAIPSDQVISTPVPKITASSVAAATEIAGTLKVVSVLKKIKWDLGDTDPIEFEGTLSVTGKQMCMGLLYATMIDTTVTIGWVVYEYDPLKKQYYVAFSNQGQGGTDVSPTGGAGVPGLIKKDSGTLMLTISPTPSSEVQSPENYDFTLHVVPGQGVPASLLLASATMRKVTKPWGRQGPATI